MELALPQEKGKQIKGLSRSYGTHIDLSVAL
jgi:hypothetical protein